MHLARGDARGWRRTQKNMAQNKDKKNCSKCGEQGHSMRTCAQMKAASAARLKEVLVYGKTQSSGT
jgi:hypothetical protein